ncbi:UNVERIFIED_ORG: hypothetical protein FHU00_5107 [Citrobacter freundii]
MWLRSALSSLQLNPGILLLLENNVMTCVSPVIILESKISADAAGIISILIIMKWMSLKLANMGPEYAWVFKHLIARQDALKYCVSMDKKRLILVAYFS